MAPIEIIENQFFDFLHLIIEVVIKAGFLKFLFMREFLKPGVHFTSNHESYSVLYHNVTRKLQHTLL